ncbi:MAG: phosphomethylpyrimidine synthase ThiC, partial [Tepidisphaeraceae bacterium]
MAKPLAFDRSYTLPPLGTNPSTDRQGTTPGSFANAPQVGGPLTYSSPDTPGMPEPSNITAMDFAAATDAQCKTQLEEARFGRVSVEARRVALREPHLTPEQIRVEVAAGRMVIPANKVHVKYKLEPMCIGRASLT